MIFWLGIAGAKETCSLDAGRFRSMLVDAQASIDRGDEANTRAVLAEFERDFTCMSFAPEPRQWAELMVIEAVVAFSGSADWQSPLAAALRIRPGIDRLVGRGHPIYAWEPPPLVELVPLPPRTRRGRSAPTRVFVDGREVEAMPPAEGWYLVQKTDGTAWETTWQRDAPMSEAWITAPVVQPPRVRYQIAGHLHGGGVIGWQTGGGNQENWGRPDGERFSRYYDMRAIDRPAEALLPAWGFNGSARVAFFSEFGVSAHAGTAWSELPAFRDIHLSLAWIGRHFVLGAGITFSEIAHRQATEPMSRFEAAALKGHPIEWTHGIERFLHVEVGTRLGNRYLTEITAVVAARSRNSVSLFLDGTFTFPPQPALQGLRPRIGGQFAGSTARLILRETANTPGERRWVDAGISRITPHVGFVIGDLP